MRAAWLAAFLFVLPGCFGGEKTPPGVAGGDPDDLPEDPLGDGIALETVATGFSQPLLLTHDGRGHLVVLEKGGRALVERDDWETWLDIRSQVSSDSERGLLGLAVDPSDADRVFVSYTDTSGDSVLSLFDASGAGLADEAVWLVVDQPASNHNGGHLAFGADGMLYWGLGDGGLRDDAYQNGQNKATLLGSILRLDVSGDAPVAPPDNPFVGDPTGADEIWVWGLRNPWRFSFDADEALWIGDVGQDAWEEIDLQEAGSAGGENYGWPAREGAHAYRGVALDPIDPIAEYANAGQECSVTGGHVAVDEDVPGLLGAYVFGDFCSGRIWTLRDDRGWSMQELMDTGMQVSSFGMDAEGRLYVVDFGGAVKRFVAA